MCEWSRALSEREGKGVGVNGEEGHCQGGGLTGSSWCVRGRENNEWPKQFCFRDLLQNEVLKEAHA